MPVDVGNSLYRYITEGRPIVKDDTVFYPATRNHIEPWGKGSADLPENAMNHIFRRSTNEKEIGFHITRSGNIYCFTYMRSGIFFPIIVFATMQE